MAQLRTAMRLRHTRGRLQKRCKHGAARAPGGGRPFPGRQGEQPELSISPPPGLSGEADTHSLLSSSISSFFWHPVEGSAMFSCMHSTTLPSASHLGRCCSQLHAGGRRQRAIPHQPPAPPSCWAICGCYQSAADACSDGVRLKEGGQKGWTLMPGAARGAAYGMPLPRERDADRYCGGATVVPFLASRNRLNQRTCHHFGGQ